MRRPPDLPVAFAVLGVDIGVGRRHRQPVEYVEFAHHLNAAADRLALAVDINALEGDGIERVFDLVGVVGGKIRHVGDDLAVEKGLLPADIPADRLFGFQIRIWRVELRTEQLKHIGVGHAFAGAGV